MARKERKALDNFDTDSDLDFQFDSFDDLYSESTKNNNRSAITSVGSGIVKGAFNALTGFGLLKRVVLKALPREFGEIDRAFSTGVSTARSLYHESIKDLGPALRDFNRASKRAIPVISKELPKGIGDKFGKLDKLIPTPEEPTRGASAEELKEQALQSQLGAVFQTGQAQTAIAQQQLVRSVVNEQVGALRHSESIKYLNAIRVSTQNIDNYNSTVNVSYQRKSLELQLRSLSIQAEMLNDSRRFAAEYMVRLDGVVKNTALPEYAKLKMSERYGEAIRNKFVGSNIDSAAERSREFLSRFGDNLKNALKDKIDSFKSAFETGSMGLEALADQAEMMRDFEEAGIEGSSLRDMLAEQIGAGGAEKLALWLGSKFGKNSKWQSSNIYQKGKYYASETIRGLRDIPGTLKGFQNSDIGDNSGLIRFFKDLIPSMSPDTSMQHVRVGNLQENAIYTTRTDKTINEIIPGLLSRQLRELTMLRTGRSDVELITYDHFKNDFVSKASMSKTIFDKVINPSTKANVKNNKDKLEEFLFDENSNVDRETRDKFFNVLLERAVHNESSSPADFINDDIYLRAGIKHDQAEKLSNLIKSKFGYDEQGKAIVSNSFSSRRRKFQEHYLDSRDNISHQQLAIQSLINAGYADELKRIGLLDDSGDFNKRQYYDYMTGSEYDASGITEKPEYEGVDRATKKGRRKGKVTRSWGTRDLDHGLNAQGIPENINQIPISSSNITVDMDKVIDAIRDANIKSIAQNSYETLQRIELIMLEKEFGSNGPNFMDKLGGYSGKVTEWFKGKFNKLSDKFEGTRKFLTSTKERANRIYDFLKGGLTGILNRGLKYGKQGFEKASKFARDAVKTGWNKATSAAGTVKDYATDTAFPYITNKASEGGKWMMNQAGKTTGRLSKAGTWIKDNFKSFKDGIKGDESYDGSSDNRGILGKAFGMAGSGLGWLGKNGLDAISGVTSRLFGGGVFGKNTQKMIDILNEIRDILDKRLPGHPHDKDGSGYRDGSWEDQLKERAERDAEANQPKTDESEASSKNGGILAALTGALTGRNKDKSSSEESGDGDTTVIGGSIDGGGSDDDKGKKGKKGDRPKPKGWKGYARRGVDGLKSFGRGLLTNPLSTLVGGALTATSTVAKGAWWLAKNAVTRVAWPLAKFVTMAIGAKPLLIAAAVAGLGYAAYKGYQHLTKVKLDKLSSIRYQQYGFLANDETHLQPVMGLESKLMNFVVERNGQYDIDDKKIEMEDVLKEFGIDIKSTSRVNDFSTWYGGRFKPVFLTWYTAVKRTQSRKSLQNVDSLPSKDKLALLDLVAFPDGPYDVTVSPFPDLRRLPVTKNIVNNSITVLRSELSDKAKHDSSESTITKNAATAAAAVTATQQALQPNLKKDDGVSKNPDLKIITNPNLSDRKSLAAGVTAGTAAIITARSENDNVTNVRMRELTPLESIRMRVYGLSSADGVKVGAILQLEELIRRNAVKQGNSVTWSGDIYDVAAKATGLFHFSSLNSSAGLEWANWFRQRFLPVYMTYLTNISNITGKFDKSDIGLNPQQMVTVANAISAATYRGNSVWSYSNSPFRNYILENDPDVLTPFIEVIARQNQGSRLLKEEAAKHMDTDAKASVSGTKAVTNNQQLAKPTTAPTPGLWERTKQTLANLATPSMAAVKAVGGYVVDKAKDVGKFFGIGTGPEANVSEGSGGIYSTLPDPGPGNTYKDYKNLLDAAAKMVGVDSKLLALIAAIESGFRPHVKANTSSATGLFQFIASTWKSMISKFGKLFGISFYANPTDPKASAVMGAKFLKENINYLKKHLNRKISYVDAYMAHFLGPAGAVEFLKYPPNTIMANVMPKAAASNGPIFFKNGRALTAAEMYSDFAAKLRRLAARWQIGVDESEFTIAPDGTTEGRLSTTDSTKGSIPSADTGTPSITSTQPGNTPTVSSNSGMSGSTPTDSPEGITNVNFTPTEPPKIPTPAVAPTATRESQIPQSAANVKQEAAVKQFQLDTTAVESILKESLKVQIEQAELLKQISTKLDRVGASSDVPDPRRDRAIQTSRPIPNAAVSLRRVI